MLKTFVAHTTELDDLNLAVSEVVSGLNLDKNLCKNSVGIIACHQEFIASGVVKALSEALPFQLVGTVSFAQATAAQAGSLVLTVMLLTSDHAEFVSVLTPSLAEEAGRVISDSYIAATATRPDKPALIMPFAPFLMQNSGDEYVEVLTKVSGGVPCFGTLAIDDSSDFSTCFMIANGQEHTDKMCMLLIYGEIKPKFFVANLSADTMFGKAAIVTKSHGHVIEELNGKPVSKYFEDLGLTRATEEKHGMSSLPFLVDFQDGTPPVSKIFITLTPENHALCAGAVPENSLLHIANGDGNDVIHTAGAAIDNLLAHASEASGALMYSCIARSMAFGVKQFEEINLITEKLQNKLPFMLANSGGEICPTSIASSATNRFHNFALIICLF
ncbi:MAG: FIST C-terminal domain-containing protein [Defluviitaleaceae bacterium]|nr:FIST C-terminal domain-containing protein [Defluviitaleaceae bacterium]